MHAPFSVHFTEEVEDASVEAEFVEGKGRGVGVQPMVSGLQEGAKGLEELVEGLGDIEAGVDGSYLDGCSFNPNG